MIKFVRWSACLAWGLMLVGHTAWAGSIPGSVLSGLSWRLIGPFGGGRVLAVSGVNTQPNTYYFGSAGGGVWKTTDNGLTWKPIFNHESVASIGAIAVSQVNPNVIYVGTGEADPRGDAAFGDGMYKSTDGGKSWQHIGLDQTRHIGRIVIDPRNPKIIYVAALGRIYFPSKHSAGSPQRGIFKSTDGGKHWKRVLYVNGHTGGIDIAVDPANPNIIYAGMWHVYRTPWYLDSGGPGDGLYKSVDGGKHWVLLSGHGLPSGVLGKIGIAFAGGSHGHRIYALIEAKDGGLYRSDDSGKSWKLVSADPRLRTRAWYFTRIYADPSNPNVAYVADNGFYKTEDGGKQWNAMPIPGGDNHGFWVNPKHPEHMIESNDQGVVVSVNGGKTWSKYYNQPLAQIYHVSTDHRFPYNIYASDQDCPNGCAFGIASRGVSGITSKDLFDVGGADGESGYVFADPNDENYILEGGYAGALTRYSMRTQTLQDIAPWSNANGGRSAADTKYRFTWTDAFAFAPWGNHPLYMGSQYFMVSRNNGMSWSVISKDLTRNDQSKQLISGGPITKDDSSIEYYDVIYSIAPSGVKQGEIWLGTDDGLVWLTMDGGKTYKNVTPPSIPKWSRVNMIEPSNFDPGTAYIAVDADKLGNDKPYIFVTHDYGSTWHSLDKGLSSPNYVYAIRQDTVNKNLLFAGTANGVDVSFDGGQEWQSLQLNLPTSEVRDITIKNSDLIVATHGRSLWSLDDISSLRQLSNQVVGNAAHLFKPETALILRMHNGRNGAGNMSGANPPNDAIDYYLRNKPKGEIKLSIYDMQGRLVNSFTNAKSGVSKPEMFAFRRHKSYDTRLTDHRGINRFVWRLRYPAAPPLHAAVGYDEGRGPNGVYVVPGKYKLVLSVDGKSYQQMMTVKNDPRSTATRANLVKQFNLAMKAQNLLWKNHAAANQIINLRQQLNKMRQRFNTKDIDKSLRMLVSKLDDKAQSLQGMLYQYKAHTGEDLLNYPIQLNARISYLSNEINILSSTTPTQQFYQEYKEYERSMDSILKRWQLLKTRDLKTLNTKLRTDHLRPIVIATGAGEKMPSAPVQIK